MSIALALLLRLQSTGDIPLTEGFSMQVRGGGRSAMRIDPIDAQIVDGTFTPPTTAGNGWVKATANKDGVFNRNGYLSFNIDSPDERVMMFSAKGNSIALVNGQPRGGDTYAAGYVTIPVLLKKGSNNLLVVAGRGSFSGTLSPAKSSFAFDTRDLTAPDILDADKGKMSAGVVLQNATKEDLKDAVIEASTDRGRVVTALPRILAISNLKVGFDFIAPKGKDLNLKLIAGGKVLTTSKIELRRRTAHQPYKRTFWSNVDHSVQYYGVNPSTNEGPGQALFLSLHGASVEGIGQAEAYSPKSWGYIAAATNRRPFGFDWEDIGRLDAIEVLEDAQKLFKTDPTKTYLTGHSMGGHGTWQVGAHFPDKFAAIMPSAGWISFNTYGGGARFPDPTPVEKMLIRGTASSDTLSLKHNYSQEAVYVLHGDADTNVPVTEARAMRKELAEFHQDLHWWEQKGADHWWDASPEPGSDCVDWMAGFDLFARRREPLDAEIREIDFTISSPGVSAKDHWLTILQQKHSFVPSRVQVHYDPLAKRIVGTTENVEAMQIDLPKQKDFTLELDGKKATILSPSKGPIILVKVDDYWMVSNLSTVPGKNPSQSGGFKSIFNRNVVCVYGTHGSKAENDWAKDKARFDAEALWVRGNGSLTLVPDDEFQAAKYKDRNVLLFGNRNTNSAWSQVLDKSDFDLTRESCTVGDKQLTEDLACMAVRPRKDSQTASVGIVGGNTIKGMRLTTRATYFTSGAGFPDCLILSPQTLKTGTKGILAAGFFGNDWSVKNGEFAWQK